MGSQGIGPHPGVDGDRSATAIGAGRAFVIGALGTAVVMAASVALSRLPGVMDQVGALMIFAVPPLLAIMVGAAAARWGDRTLWAAIAGALGGWLACAALPYGLTLVGGRIDPVFYPYWLIAAGTVGLLAYVVGFSAGWWFSER
jgi:hypothetical protein